MNLADPVSDWPRLQTMLREKGRPVEDFGAQFLANRSPRYAFDLLELAEMALRLLDLGATEITPGSINRDFRSEQEHIDFLNQVKNAINVALRRSPSAVGAAMPLPDPR